MTFLRRSWARARRWASRYEPARARAGWTALVALLATQGISVSADVDGRVQAALGALAVVLPLLQGELTRAAVYSPATTGQVANSAAYLAVEQGVPPERAATIAIDAGAHMRPEG